MTTLTVTSSPLPSSNTHFNLESINSSFLTLFHYTTTMVTNELHQSNATRQPLWTHIPDNSGILTTNRNRYGKTLARKTTHRGIGYKSPIYTQMLAWLALS